MVPVAEVVNETDEVAGVLDASMIANDVVVLAGATAAAIAATCSASGMSCLRRRLQAPSFHLKSVVEKRLQVNMLRPILLLALLHSVLTATTTLLIPGMTRDQRIPLSSNSLITWRGALFAMVIARPLSL